MARRRRARDSGSTGIASRDRKTPPIRHGPSPFTGSGNYHAGVDFNGPRGSDILSVADGVVRITWQKPDERGTPITDSTWGPCVMATVHPSSLLRVPDPAMREYVQLLAGYALTGGTVKEAAHEVGPGRRVATFTDADGNVLGLLQDC